MDYETIDYDFGYLTKAIYDLTCECPHKRKEALNEIKNQLNLFFKDFICKEVIFTNNTDNEFFGIQISPYLKDPDLYYEMFKPDKYSDIRFDHYSIEFDSKLFDGDFNVRQILALMIHDINKLNSSNLLKNIIGMMDHICMCSGERIVNNNITHNLPFFIFALQDTARKMTSAFEFISADLCIADDFIRSYGLNKDYEDGMYSIRKCRNDLEYQVDNVAITMNWYLNRYHMNDHAYYELADELRECIKFTGSKLIRRTINTAIDNIVGCERRQYEHRYYKSLTESAKKKMSLVSQIKYSGLKSLEDDIYEYRMRIKNVETENDAIYIIRQINNRMGIISDYLETEELSDTDRERFFKLYDKYDALREELSKKAVYNRKMYGLFVDYNALQQMSNGSMTMNTYY